MMQNLGKKLYENKFVLKMSICGFILGSIYSILGDEFHNLDNLKKMITISPPEFEIISAGKITSENLHYLHEKIQGKFYHGKKIVGKL